MLLPDSWYGGALAVDRKHGTPAMRWWIWVDVWRIWQGIGRKGRFSDIQLLQWIGWGETKLAIFTTVNAIQKKAYFTLSVWDAPAWLYLRCPDLCERRGWEVNIWLPGANASLKFSLTTTYHRHKREAALSGYRTQAALYCWFAQGRTDQTNTSYYQ